MSLGEFEIIERFFRRPNDRARADVRLGIGDDAALLVLAPDHELVAAVDTIVAGRHFFPDADPRSIGHRALAVNLSDFAAMGAVPAWALLALTLPRAEPEWLSDFATGWFALADRYGVALVGGDTTLGPLTISVQLLGYVPRGAALRRSGGKAGDTILVTGTLGDAGAGLQIARGACDPGSTTSPESRALLERFEYPQPRVEFGIAARALASAAMDISDGLIGDLPKLAAASGVAAHVDVGLLPLSAPLRAYASATQAREWAMAAGDDYELLLTVAPGREFALCDAAAQSGLALTAIGELRAGQGVTWSMDGQEIGSALKGFDHFR